MISLLQVPRGRLATGSADCIRRVARPPTPIHGCVDTRGVSYTNAVRPLASSAAAAAELPTRRSAGGGEMTTPRGTRTKNCRHTIGHRSSPKRGTALRHAATECRDLGYDIGTRIAGRRSEKSNIRQQRRS